MRTGPLARAALLSAATLLGPAPAAAATTYYLDVQGLVEASDLVVVAEIVESHVFVGNYGRITTEWTLRVDATLAGDPVVEVRVRQWAGTLDGRVETVPGDARLSVGDRKVFFLRGDGSGTMFLTALSQSVFEIHTEILPGAGIVTVPDIASGVLLSGGSARTLVADLPLVVPVSRDLEDLVLFVRGDTGPERLERGREVYTLGDLVRDVRAAWEARP